MLIVHLKLIILFYSKIFHSFIYLNHSFNQSAFKYSFQELYYLNFIQTTCLKSNILTHKSTSKNNLKPTFTIRPKSIGGTSLLILSQIENYTITQKLGRGKYSHVFEGNDKKHRRKVAVKVILPIKPEKIKREYVIQKMLNHPNIIKLHDIVRCPK